MGCRGGLSLTRLGRLVGVVRWVGGLVGWWAGVLGTLRLHRELPVFFFIRGRLKCATVPWIQDLRIPRLRSISNDRYSMSLGSHNCVQVVFTFHVSGRLCSVCLAGRQDLNLDELGVLDFRHTAMPTWDVLRAFCEK